MLTLSRYPEERIFIDVPAGPARRIEVLLSSIRGEQVRLSFAADRDVRILREEVADGKDAA